MLTWTFLTGVDGWGWDTPPEWGWDTAAEWGWDTPPEWGWDTAAEWGWDTVAEWGWEAEWGAAAEGEIAGRMNFELGMGGPTAGLFTRGLEGLWFWNLSLICNNDWHKWFLYLPKIKNWIILFIYLRENHQI